MEACLDNVESHGKIHGHDTGSRTKLWVRVRVPPLG